MHPLRTSARSSTRSEGHVETIDRRKRVTSSWVRQASRCRAGSRLPKPQRASSSSRMAAGAAATAPPRADCTAPQRAGLATLLFDLLTEEEALDRQQVFDVELLAVRLIVARRWAAKQPEVGHLPLGYFGASTGAAAALWAAADDPSVGAIVSRGGRPISPHRACSGRTHLLIVGGRDDVVLRLNQQAARAMTCECRLAIVEGATHLFAEPGTLEVAGDLAAEWLVRQLASAPPNEVSGA